MDMQRLSTECRTDFLRDPKQNTNYITFQLVKTMKEIEIQISSPLPSQREKKIKKRQPYFLIDANIGPGKTGRIVLHEGDDPLSVTENFARAFQISQEMKVELFEMLKK